MQQVDMEGDEGCRCVVQLFFFVLRSAHNGVGSRRWVSVRGIQFHRCANLCAFSCRGEVCIVGTASHSLELVIVFHSFYFCHNRCVYSCIGHARTHSNTHKQRALVKRCFVQSCRQAILASTHFAYTLARDAHSCECSFKSACGHMLSHRLSPLRGSSR